MERVPPATISETHATPSEAIPECVMILLWDMDAKSVNISQHKALILERVMSRGTFAAMQWLLKTIPKDDIIDFLNVRGQRLLSPRDLAYWSIVCGMTPIQRPGGSRRSWTG